MGGGGRCALAREVEMLWFFLGSFAITTSLRLWISETVLSGGTEKI